MKRTKEVCGILLGAAILLMGLWIHPKQVHADAIASFSYVENPYWNTKVVGSSLIDFIKYKTDGPDGEVVVYENPDGEDIVTTVKNGTKFKSQQVYEDEECNFWVYYVDLGDDIYGWVPYEHLTGAYNTVSFLTEYEDQIIEEEWELDHILMEKEVYFWEYPGSKNNDQDSVNWGKKIFVDELGRKWGCSRTYDWICLDAPTANFKTLFPNGAPERGKDSAAGVWIGLVGLEWHYVIVVGVLIAVVIGTTLILLKKLQKK